MKKIMILFVVMISQNLFAIYDLDFVINHTLENNHDLKSVEHKLEALESKSNLVQNIMNPMFMIEYSNVPFDSWKLDENPMSGIQFKLQQQITLPGKNSTKKEIVNLESKITEEIFSLQKLMLEKKIKTLFSTLTMVRRLRSVTELRIIFMNSLKETMTIKYETGKMKQYDIIRLDLMIESMNENLIDFDNKEANIIEIIKSVSEINNLDKDNVKSDEFQISDTLILNELIQQLQYNNNFKKIELEKLIHRKEQKLAKINRFKDPSLWVGYRYRKDIGEMENVDLMSLGFSVPLPIEYKRKTKHKLDLEKSLENVKEEKYSNKLSILEAELKTNYNDWKRARDKAQKYKNEIIPNAEKALEILLTSYFTNKADFGAIYQAENQLLNYEQELIKTLYNQSVAEINIFNLTSNGSDK